MEKTQKQSVWHYLEENLEQILMTVLLIAMAVILLIQVVSRYVFGNPLSWTEEIARYLFIWSAFISVCLCTRKCISIKIDQFIKMFSERGMAMFKLLNLTLSLILFVYLIPYAYKYLVATIESGQVSPACGIPMYYVQSAPLICFILCTIRLLQRWVINFKIVLGADPESTKLPEGHLDEMITEAVVDGDIPVIHDTVNDEEGGDR